MTEAQIIELTLLVEAYITSYFARIVPEADQRWPYLWADRPVREEYRAVLFFVQNLEIARERYAESSTESFVDDLLSEALGDATRVEAGVRDLAALLSHDLVTRLYIPLNGVASDASTYDLGALRLVRMDDEAFDRLIVTPYADVMRGNSHYDHAQQTGWIEIHGRELESLRGRVCAEIATKLDIPKTFAFAEDVAIDSLCDFLQFAASLFLAHDSKLRIAWAGDAGIIWRHAFALSDDPRRHSNRHSELVTVGHPFEISADRVAKIAELGLTRIADAVGRSAPSEYDQMLQRAVRWFAKGERELHADDRKLSYVTAVDLFFSEIGPGATKRVCEGFAFALARDDDALPRVARYMFHAFASRSATSHAGELGVMNDKELQSLRWHVQQFIIAMARQAFSDKNDVVTWVGSRRAALGVDQSRMLRESTDWKVIETEDYLLAIEAVLRTLATDHHLSEKSSAKSSALADVLRAAARNGGKVLRDLRPLLPALNNLHDSIVARIRDSNIDSKGASDYLKQVIMLVTRVRWIREALKS
jgi:hypothetical protein